MTKALQRILLSSMLAAAAACSSSSNSTPDGSAGTDGGSDASAGTTGAAGSTGGAGTTGAAGTDGGAPDAPATTDATGAAGSDGGTGDTSPGDTSPGDGGGTTTTTAALTAANGGTVPVTGGSLKIPAGALSADTTITVKELTPGASTPNKDLINGLIYDLGPDGTKFKTPVELALPFAGTLPAGKEAVIAFLDPTTNVWVPLSSSLVGAAGAQKVIALATHFTSFAVLLVTTGGVCPAITPCGGSLVGAWEITTFCQAKPTKAVTVDCGDGTFNAARAVFDLTGTLTVGADNAYTFVRTIHVDRLSNSAPACIVRTNQVKDPKITMCSDLVADLNKEFGVTTTTCAGTVTAGCTCYSPTPMPATETGTIAVEGTSLVATKTGAQPGAADSFCVKGNILTVKTAAGDVYTAVKKPQ